MTKAPVRPGDKVPFGDIVVGELLGEGGFGRVYAARVAEIDFPFAIKFFDPHPFNTDVETARNRFAREAEVLLHLRHPYICGIYGMGQHGGMPYILMERCSGLNLYKAREARVPDPLKVLPFIERMAGALGHAHNKNVVHRDIKPANLMASQLDGRVLDFGIAAALDPDGTRFTRTGQSPVGDSFSAPELLADPHLRDPRCDIFSLGACWFWLLTGSAPKGLSLQAVLRRSTKITQDYEQVVLRCLDQQDARYSTMRELEAEVKALLEGGKPEASRDQITDEDALVFGTVATGCSAPGVSATYYSVEQELKGAVSSYALGVCTRKLRRLNLVEVVHEVDYNGNESEGMTLTAAGEQWAEDNRYRVEALMGNTRPVEAPRKVEVDSMDDIPF